MASKSSGENYNGSRVKQELKQEAEEAEEAAAANRRSLF